MTAHKVSPSTPSTRKITWITASLVIIILLGGYFFHAQVSVASQNKDEILSQTVIVRRGDLTVSASGSGTLVAQTEASFGFDTSGQVTQVYVQAGDPVEKGQVLAELDDTLAQMKYEEARRALQELHSAASVAEIQQEIATAQDTEAAAREWLAYLISSDVVQAEENLAIARQRLAEAQAAAKAAPSAETEQAVEQAQQSVDYLSDKLSQAWTYYNNVYLPKTFGVYENAGTRRHPKQVLATTTDLVTGEEIPEIHAPSASDLANARNAISQAQETISEGQAYLDILSSGIISDTALGARITTLYEAQLALENAQSALDATRLVAPISGTVTSLDLSIGEQAGNSPVTTISQLSQPYTLDVYLNEADWNMAQEDNQVNVTFDLLPDQTYPGKVTLVYPELSPSFESSLVHLIVQLDQSLSQDLPAGTGATVEVIGGEAKDVLLVPVDAIHKGQNGSPYVTLLQNGQRVEREITTGLQSDSYAEVTSGLEAGETVVIE